MGGQAAERSCGEGRREDEGGGEMEEGWEQRSLEGRREKGTDGVDGAGGS